MAYQDDYGQTDSGTYSRADQQRRLAQLLAAQGASMEPIASGWQGAARLAQALAGVLGNRAADKRERAQQQADLAAIYGGLGMLGGGGGATAPDIGPATTGSISGGDAGVGGAQPYDLAQATNLLRQGAIARGMDPDVVVRGFKSEGLVPGVYQSRVPTGGGGREQSYGPLQLYAGGGLGNEFMQTTGLDLRDPRTVPQQIEFGLNKLQQGGWGPWNGPTKVLGYDRWQGINRGGGGQQAAAGTAALPDVVPVGSAPTPDVAQFVGQPPSQQPPSLADRQALIRQVLTGARESPADVAADVRKYYANKPGSGALTGTGTRPGPGYVPAPAPIGRGAVAQPVAGTPMPTRPTVTGSQAVMPIPRPLLPSNDPMVQPSAVSPPDAMGRPGTPATEARLATLQPANGHTSMALQPEPPPAPMGRGMSIGPYGGQIPSPVAETDALAPVATPQTPAVDPIARALMAATPTGTDLGAPSAALSMDVPSLPRPRPVAPLPSMPPGQQAVPIQPPAPQARVPVARPAPAVASPVVQPAVGPATTAAIPQQRGQIFREPAMSAQEFARQGQNYLTGRPSFANQQRVAPRTMQEPVAGMAGGAPAGSPAAAPASPRQGLIQRLFGGGGGGGAAAAQAAPTGSPVAGGGDPQRMALAQVLANPNMPAAVKAALIERLNPKEKPLIGASPGETLYDPNTHQPIFSVPAKPERTFQEELELRRAGAQKAVAAPPPGYKVNYDENGNPISMEQIPGSPDEEKAALQKTQQAATAQMVTQDIDRSIDAITKNPNLTTGWGGTILRNAPETKAHDVRALIAGVQTNIGLEALNAMRQASPTGAGLGNVTEAENAMLQRAQGDLDQSQGKDQLLFNLRRVRATFQYVLDHTPIPEEFTKGVPGTSSPENTTPGGVKWKLRP